MQQQHPIATWNPEHDYWETPEVDIFGHSVAYSETLPKSGTTRNGQLYEHPTSAHPTTAPESSSSPGRMFPTPQAVDGIMGRPKTTGRPIEKSTHLTTIVTLLPTPNATMGDRGHSSTVGGAQAQRPTTTSGLEHGSGAPSDTTRIVSERAGETRDGWPRPTDRHNRNIEWGKYAPAIRRWGRALGVAAPNPTEPNTKGNPRLAAPFAEWLMGLPTGWVTNPEIGLTRAQQLKALGNGVVPQQAQAAITHLLERTV